MVRPNRHADPIGPHSLEAVVKAAQLGSRRAKALRTQPELDRAKARRHNTTQKTFQFRSARFPPFGRSHDGVAIVAI
jgi:hypothetical protein